MRIVHKDKWGFWIFRRYTFTMEKSDNTLVEVFVPKSTWLRFGVGDYYDVVYQQFFKYDQRDY